MNHKKSKLNTILAPKIVLLNPENNAKTLFIDICCKTELKTHLLIDFGQLCSKAIPCEKSKKKITNFFLYY